MEDELLEYETEAEDCGCSEAVAEIAPVPVVVRAPIETIETVPQHISCSTVVVATGIDGGYDVLLAQDSLRVRATILVNDEPVVLCHSRAQASSSSNQAASVPFPSGAYLPVGGPPVVVSGTQEMFVAATSSTPARVSVIVERRSI